MISLIGMTTPSVWYDESATITSATRSWPELWRMIGNVDAVHATYYAFMHLVFDVIGYSPFSLRLPSAIAVGIAAALIVVLVRQFSTTGVGVLSGLLFCTLPRVTWMGTEGRSYAISAALAVGLTIVLVHAIRSPSRRWWVLYTALAILSCAVFIYLAVVVVAHGFTMAWWLSSARKAAVRSVLRWAVASVIAMVLLLPLALAIVDQSGQLGWIDPLGRDTWRQIFRTQWFLYSYPFAIAAWLLMVVGAVLMARRSRGLSLAAVVLPVLIVPTATFVVATAVYSPLYSPRYLTMCTPFVGIAMGYAIASIRPRLAAVIPFVLVIALAVPPAVNERQPQAKQDSTWSEVAGLIAEQRAEEGPDATTAIIYGWVRRHPTATSRVIAYSYPDAFEGTVDVTLTTPAAETGRLWEKRAPLSASLDRLEGADVAFLITSIKRDLRQETTATMESVGWRLDESWNLGDVNVLRYERAGG